MYIPLKQITFNWLCTGATAAERKLTGDYCKALARARLGLSISNALRAPRVPK